MKYHFLAAEIGFGVLFSGVLWRVVYKRVATLSRASSTRSLGGAIFYVQLIFTSHNVTTFVLSY